MLAPKSPAHRGDRLGMCQDQSNVWEDGVDTEIQDTEALGRSLGPQHTVPGLSFLA